MPALVQCGNFERTCHHGASLKPALHAAVRMLWMYVIYNCLAGEIESHDAWLYYYMTHDACPLTQWDGVHRQPRALWPTLMIHDAACICRREGIGAEEGRQATEADIPVMLRNPPTSITRRLRHGDPACAMAQQRVDKHRIICIEPVCGTDDAA